ncbi:MAG: polysaccharide biosynthesis tyrosine autokinase [Bacillota bacterium]
MMVQGERTPWVSAETSGPGLLQISFRHPWFVLLGITAGLLAGVSYLALATPQYTSSAKLYVQQVRPRVLVEVEPRLTFDSNASFVNMQKTILTSAPVLATALEKPGVRQVKALAGKGDVLAALGKQLRVDVGKKDDTISVEFDAADRSEGEVVVRAVVEAYIAQCSNQGRHTADELLRILEEQRTTCESQIAQQNDAMLKLKQAAGTVSFDLRDSPRLQSLQNLKDELKAVHTEAVAAETPYKEAVAAYARDPEQRKRIEDLEKSSAITIASDLENAQLRWTIADLELRLNELVKSYRYMPQHPQVRAAQARLDELTSAYVVATKRRWMAAKEREEKLGQAIEVQQAAVADYAGKAAEYAKMDAELRRLERRADVLDGRINEVRAGQSTGALNVTVLEPAHADLKPSKPRKTRSLGAAILGGLVLGTGLAYFRERRMPRLYTIEETKASIALPVLGLLPRMPFRPISGSRMLPAQRQPLSHIAEACRTIGTAIQFTTPAGQCRRLVVTSPMSGEGKSTVAGNLAAVLAQSGKRVLIIDADLRNPTLHRTFGIDGRIGLTSVLSGETAAPDAVRPTTVAGLDILPCGPVPRDCWQFADGRFQAMLDELSETYDHILVDTPAVTASSNVRVIAALCDAVLLVVRIGKTDPRLAESACDGLLNLGARILGVVINAVPGTAGRDVSYFEPPASGVMPGERMLPAETRARPEQVKGNESLKPAHWAAALRG